MLRRQSLLLLDRFSEQRRTGDRRSSLIQEPLAARIGVGNSCGESRATSKGRGARIVAIRGRQAIAQRFLGERSAP